MEPLHRMGKAIFIVASVIIVVSFLLLQTIKAQDKAITNPDTKNFSAIGYISAINNDLIEIGNANGPLGETDASYSGSLANLSRIIDKKYKQISINDLEIGDQVTIQGFSTDGNIYVKRVILMAKDPIVVPVATTTPSVEHDKEVSSTTSISTSTSTSTSASIIGETPRIPTPGSDDVSTTTSSLPESEDTSSATSTTTSTTTETVVTDTDSSDTTSSSTSNSITSGSTIETTEFPAEVTPLPVDQPSTTTDDFGQTDQAAFADDNNVSASTTDVE